MRFLFLMDPTHTMIPDKDTSLALMRGTEARGHQAFHCLLRDLSWDGHTPRARVCRLSLCDQGSRAILSPSETVSLSQFDAIFVRKDPPFDVEYAHATRLLDGLCGRVLVVNSPAGLRDCNEKLLALHFPSYVPRTLVAAHPDRLLEFLAEVGGMGVLKPLDGAGGVGVVRVSIRDGNARALFDHFTGEGRRLALLQEFLPEVRRGDTRVLVLDGLPLGAIRRVPRDDDFRANIHVGGRAEPTELDPEETKLVLAVGIQLRQRGLYFAGLDLIGRRLIEINVTSPTGLQQLSHHLGRPMEHEVISWVERTVAKRKSEICHG